jgi:hypothetical protein
MYVVVLHQFRDPPTAFARGQKLIMNEGAPPGVRGLQFYPSADGSVVTCLWESDSVEMIQEYVDSTLGDSSANTCYEVDAEQRLPSSRSGFGRPRRSAGSQQKRPAVRPRAWSADASLRPCDASRATGSPWPCRTRGRGSPCC